MILVTCNRCKQTAWALPNNPPENKLTRKFLGGRNEEFICCRTCGYWIVCNWSHGTYRELTRMERDQMWADDETREWLKVWEKEYAEMIGAWG